MSDASEMLMAVKGVQVAYGRGARRVVALDGVDLELPRGAALGLVGESGSGKSTLARLLLGLEPPACGSVSYAGRPVSDWLRREPGLFRRKVQLVFQDPFGSLNPRLTVGSALSEVLRIHGLADRSSERAAVVELLRSVGLEEAHARRYPHEFSGGQRQRVAIARALATGPEVLIADEPVSALDVSVQAQILNLLKELREQRGLTLLLIAHDLAAVRYVCDRLVVLHRGRVVESGEAEAILQAPSAPYTRQLLAAVPELP